MFFKWIYLIILVYYCIPCVLSFDESYKKDDGYIIKLHRQKTSFEQHLNNAHMLKKSGIDVDWLYKKHHHKGDKRTNDSIALYQYLDNEFYGKVVIGHPGQTLNVAFDTAWTLSWVLSSQCHEFTNIGCLFHNKYDHTKSSQWKSDGRKIVVPDGDYNMTGFFSYDSFSIAHSNVTNFSFVEITSVPRTMILSKIDGVLGLGLQGDSYEPFFHQMVRQQKIKSPIFCIYLSRDKQSNHGGNIIMGFLEYRHVHSKKDQNNNTIYDPIKYMPVKPGFFWQFDLDSVFLDDKKEAPLVFCGGSAKCTAITDTSSNNIIGPSVDVEKIHIAIKASPFYLNRYRVDCNTVNKLPQIGFTIGGQNFTLKGRDYTVKISYMSFQVCLSAFIPNNDYDNFWVLGGAFLSEYYTIYNVEDKKIGFVKAA